MSLAKWHKINTHRKRIRKELFIEDFAMVGIGEKGILHQSAPRWAHDAVSDISALLPSTEAKNVIAGLRHTVNGNSHGRSKDFTEYPEGTIRTIHPNWSGHNGNLLVEIIKDLEMAKWVLAARREQIRLHREIGGTAWSADTIAWKMPTEFVGKDEAKTNTAHEEVKEEVIDCQKEEVIDKAKRLMLKAQAKIDRHAKVTGNKSAEQNWRIIYNALASDDGTSEALATAKNIRSRGYSVELLGEIIDYFNEA